MDTDAKPGPRGLWPGDLCVRRADGPITFGGIQGDGSGQTIAIIDAYDDPNALSDLNAFSTYFGLPTFGGNERPHIRETQSNRRHIAAGHGSPGAVEHYRQ